MVIAFMDAYWDSTNLLSKHTKFHTCTLHFALFTEWTDMEIKIAEHNGTQWVIKMLFIFPSLGRASIPFLSLVT